MRPARVAWVVAFVAAFGACPRPGAAAPSKADPGRSPEEAKAALPGTDGEGAAKARPSKAGSGAKAASGAAGAAEPRAASKAPSVPAESKAPSAPVESKAPTAPVESKAPGAPAARKPEPVRESKAGKGGASTAAKVAGSSAGSATAAPEGTTGATTPSAPSSGQQPAPRAPGDASAAAAPPAAPAGAAPDPVPSDAEIAAALAAISDGVGAELPMGPGAGTGERKVRQPERTEPPVRAAELESKSTTHRAGKPPRHPRATLPDGAPQPSPDDAGRRLIAGGPTVDDASRAKGDPDLQALELAERVLFPRPLRGVRAGFSWEPPGAADDGSAAVEASGLPLVEFFRESPDKPGAAPNAEWLRALAMPNVPVRLDARVVKYLEFYRDDPRGRNILRHWAKKCGRLVPALRAELSRGGLPTDLVWLSLIESGHNPTIVSPAGAAGLWQFIPESARLYGLTVDRWVDERLDPQRATEAAVRYLNDLRTRFGTWELAMAAYNMGHGGLLRALRKFNTNDFWGLSRYEAGLPWETTLYVPKILATAIAMANRKAFGIDDIEPDAPISFDTVSVGPNVDLAEVARAADVPEVELRALNAQYLSFRTPPTAAGSRRFGVRVPAGKGLVAEQRLASAARRPPGSTEPHVVRFGDTVESVARLYGVTPREIAQENRIAEGERLRAGDILVVPHPRDRADDDSPVEEEVVVVPARRFAETGRRRVFYKVLPGDDPAEIAAAFGVTRSEVVLWNALDKAANLQPGMSLQLFVPVEADLPRVRYLEEHDVRVLVAGTESFFEHFEGQNGRRRFVVVARKGDTLATIGKRHGMSPGMMERINRLPASTAVREGERVVVYTKTEPDGASVAPLELAQRLPAVSAPAPDALPPLPPGVAPPNGTRSVTP